MFLADLRSELKLFFLEMVGIASQGPQCPTRERSAREGGRKPARRDCRPVGAGGEVVVDGAGKWPEVRGERWTGGWKCAGKGGLLGAR